MRRKYHKMKITCSILCYNYGRFLSQAIESCLNQEAGDYELDILIIDDGSTEETPEICQTYREHIRYLRSAHQGFGSSLERAIREASGEYVCLLDADDYFAGDKIITLLPEIRKRYLYIQHRQYYVNQNGRMIDSMIHNGGNTSTLCLNRSAALTLLPAQNEIFFHPLKSANMGVELNKPLTFHRLHASSMTDYGRAGAWYNYLAKVTHALADHLLAMKSKPCSWADSKMLELLSKEYRAIAFYDEMEGALELRQRKEAILASLKILMNAVGSRTGLAMWHCKSAIRGIFGVRGPAHYSYKRIFEKYIANDTSGGVQIP